MVRQHLILAESNSFLQSVRIDVEAEHKRSYTNNLTKNQRARLIIIIIIQKRHTNTHTHTHTHTHTTSTTLLLLILLLYLLIKTRNTIVCFIRLSHVVASICALGPHKGDNHHSLPRAVASGPSKY